MATQKRKRAPLENAEFEQVRLRAKELEREIQSLRLELSEQAVQLNAAKHDLNLYRKESESKVSRDIHEQQRKQYEELAGPIAQLTTLDHLLHSQGKELQPKDILVVANRFIRILQKYGLNLDGSIGEITSFDRNLHEPLSTEEDIALGEMVMIRMVGVSYQGTVLRRASVTRHAVAESTRSRQ